jgi:hypothetical protein
MASLLCCWVAALCAAKRDGLAGGAVPLLCAASVMAALRLWSCSTCWAWLCALRLRLCSACLGPLSCSMSSACPSMGLPPA